MSESVQQEQRHYSWDSGMPTGPDVAALQRQWPNLQPGQRIPYEDVETVLGVERDNVRWRSITDAWRKRELQAGRVIECLPGVAFVVATGDQISANTHSVLGHIRRSARKQRTKLVTVKPADSLQKQTIEHQCRLMTVVEREARKGQLNILPNTAAQTRPQIGPPKAANGE